MPSDEVWSTRDYATYLAGQPYGHATLLRQEPPPAASAASELPESRFLAQVRGLAKRAGWLCYHTHDSRRSEEGFPDLVLSNGQRVIFAELKSATGKLTDQQTRWLEMLGHTGLVETYVWRPADLPLIVTLLHQKD